MNTIPNISEFYKDNKIDDDFDEIEYKILHPQANNFYQPYCKQNNIDDRHRLFYHYYFYGIRSKILKLPKLSLSGTVSLVLLNWQRTNLLKNALNKYVKYNIIKDIVVVNNNKSIHLDYYNHKTTIINANKDLGLFSRYIVAPLMQTEAIIFIDDDMVIHEKVIENLYNNWQKEQFLIHGLVGRQINENMSYNIEEKEGVDDYPIVLTKCCMTHKNIVIKTLRYVHKFNKCFYDSQPLGNGEDILMSIVALKHNNKNNKVYNFPYNEYTNTNNGIHERWHKHLSHRTEVVRWCMKNIKI